MEKKKIVGVLEEEKRWIPKVRDETMRIIEIFQNENLASVRCSLTECNEERVRISIDLWLWLMQTSAPRLTVVVDSLFNATGKIWRGCGTRYRYAQKWNSCLERRRTVKTRSLHVGSDQKMERRRCFQREGRKFRITRLERKWESKEMWVLWSSGIIVTNVWLLGICWTVLCAARTLIVEVKSREGRCDILDSKLC